MLLLHGCSAEEAARLLNEAGGRLRTALKNIGRREASALAEAAQLGEDEIPTIAEELPSAVPDGDANKPRR
jgi:hypothetical protein